MESGLLSIRHKPDLYPRNKIYQIQAKKSVGKRRDSLSAKQLIVKQSHLSSSGPSVSNLIEPSFLRKFDRSTFVVVANGKNMLGFLLIIFILLPYSFTQYQYYQGSYPYYQRFYQSQHYNPNPHNPYSTICKIYI